MSTLRSIEDVKRTVSVDQILRAYGSAPDNNGRWHCICPERHTHGDADPSVTIDGDTATCWSQRCFEHADIYTLVGLKEGLTSFFEKKRCVLALAGLSEPTRQGCGTIEATYDYPDENGTLLYQVVRYDPKGFRQRRPDGQGGWIWSLKDTRRVLYRLPDILRADHVLVVEGEKDVDTAYGLSLPPGWAATCNPMGAGKWRPEYSESLQGKRVVILPDADEPGRKHGDTIAQALTGKAQEILKLTLPDGVKDLSEWASEGKSSAELLALLQSALAYHGQDDGPRAAAPVGPSPSQPDTQPQRLTDLGNGECFADQHRHRARYCYALETWFICDETSLWERDPGNLVMQLAKHSVRALYDDAQREPNDECRIKLAKHAIQSESAERLKNMIVLARSEPGMALSPDDFDPDPWLLSVANGVINLRTGQLRLREWADFITKRSPIHFDPHATCPTFQRFLDRIFQNDQSLIAYLQQVVGYCLTGLTSEQQFFLLWGSGANGKSTLLTVLLGLLGNYGLQTPAETFLRRKQDGRATPELARLAGARLAVACESDQGCRLAEGLIKQMTGNDRIAARGLWENIFEFTPTHKILLATNHKPRIDDATHAMWRRMCLIPFEVQIPDHEQDRQLAATLLTELPGILNWALIGCLEWQAEGRLQTPEAVTVATHTYREEQDVLGDFLRERTVTEPHASVRFADLRPEYVTWAHERGDEPLSSKALGQALIERGYRPGRQRDGRYYSGLRLRRLDDGDELTAEPVSMQAEVNLDAD